MNAQTKSQARAVKTPELKEAGATAGRAAATRTTGAATPPVEHEGRDSTQAATPIEASSADAIPPAESAAGQTVATPSTPLSRPTDTPAPSVATVAPTAPASLVATMGAAALVTATAAASVITVKANVLGLDLTTVFKGKTGSEGDSDGDSSEDPGKDAAPTETE